MAQGYDKRHISRAINFVQIYYSNLRFLIQFNLISSKKAAASFLFFLFPFFCPHTPPPPPPPPPHPLLSWSFLNSNSRNIVTIVCSFYHVASREHLWPRLLHYNTIFDRRQKPVTANTQNSVSSLLL